MYILNIEDDVIKYMNIRKVLESDNFTDLDIENVNNLEDAIELIEKRNNEEKMYDLIITDMWYPKHKHGKEEESGLTLIETVKHKKINTQIILISSVKYNIDGILGSVYYSDREEWESKLISLIHLL